MGCKSCQGSRPGSPFKLSSQQPCGVGQAERQPLVQTYPVSRTVAEQGSEPRPPSQAQVSPGAPRPHQPSHVTATPLGVSDRNACPPRPEVLAGKQLGFPGSKGGTPALSYRVSPTKGELAIKHSSQVFCCNLRELAQSNLWLAGRTLAGRSLDSQSGLSHPSLLIIQKELKSRRHPRGLWGLAPFCRGGIHNLRWAILEAQRTCEGQVARRQPPGCGLHSCQGCSLPAQHAQSRSACSCHGLGQGKRPAFCATPVPVLAASRRATTQPCGVQGEACPACPAGKGLPGASGLPLQGCVGVSEPGRNCQRCHHLPGSCSGASSAAQPGAPAGCSSASSLGREAQDGVQSGSRHHVFGPRVCSWAQEVRSCQA